jgi:DNA-binding transcriptional LysR family regulator
VFNNIGMRVRAALGGLGLAHISGDAVRPYLSDGRLVPVLEDWCPTFSGYHLYYPSRRQHAPAFTLPVDAARYRAWTPGIECITYRRCDRGGCKTLQSGAMKACRSRCQVVE